MKAIRNRIGLVDYCVVWDAQLSVNLGHNIHSSSSVSVSPTSVYFCVSACVRVFTATECHVATHVCTGTS